MKTTVDLPQPLLDAARSAAREDGTTLRALVETGLRQVLAQRARSERFVLEDASFTGEGLQPEFEGAGWERVRDALYDRGVPDRGTPDPGADGTDP